MSPGLVDECAQLPWTAAREPSEPLQPVASTGYPVMERAMNLKSERTELSREIRMGSVSAPRCLLIDWPSRHGRRLSYVTRTTYLADLGD
jgi:hypothetical protein